MSGEPLPDAQREKAELIEDALLMNLILSFPVEAEALEGEGAVAHRPAPPAVHNERQPRR